MSRLEQRKDMLVSSLVNYLEALGAGVRNNANLVPDAERLRGGLKSGQLTLPIIGGPAVTVRRDLVLSIKPEYSTKIVSGGTIELRRRFSANVRPGTIVLIYESSPTPAIIGMARIAEVLHGPTTRSGNQSTMRRRATPQRFRFLLRRCQDRLCHKTRGARPLKRALELQELRDRFRFEPPQSSSMRLRNCARRFSMSAPNYLIDTNVFIHLEDAATVPPEFALLLQLAAKHGVGVFVHEAARDDIARDKDIARRQISLSKVDKFRRIAKVRGLSGADLAQQFGALSKPNDVVDATLLHALTIGVADFLITQDQGLHDRARRHSAELAGRVLYVADAVSLLRSTYEPLEIAIPFVEEIDAHAIPLSDPIFDSLREGYPEFDDWWRSKCVKEMRKCWVVTNEGQLGGLIVRKDEVGGTPMPSFPARKSEDLHVQGPSRTPWREAGRIAASSRSSGYSQTNAYDVAYCDGGSHSANPVSS